ncbi:MAG: hypothetical protein AB1941_08330 [Gemmatimonadota bacterium]
MLSNIFGGRKAAQLIAAAAVAVGAIAADTSTAAAQGTGNTCYACYPCTQPDGSPGHYFDGSLAGAGQQGLTNPDEAFVCESGTCANPTDNRHRPCIGGTALTEITRAAKTGDVVRLAALVKEHGATVEVNAARGALQVVGCTGAIMAHVALKNEEIARLALAD